MYLAKVYVMYKESVLDPQGEAVKKAIHKLDYEEVADVRMGKYFELKIAKSDRDVSDVVEDICNKLLSNVNMESYRYEIMEEE
ncbi:phosphoribosylformylglycinamidine synthase subunit PurS [Vagococcus acidifermentans]|uniref:Phosphoribosylformylglycinamidine synthase subunit PurS n=1 Tax=Vagococcus acidifermentans TaxID=564710 RepID=A0A430AND4_9ENTE|nr:phosphoribosylformylglycinamidine synthase subunit PurS [Vagococcus acidifermentans]RSU09622.1 phosphoribosylformylglycinamidine synthase [Vagococcus acidifermentans]